MASQAQVDANRRNAQSSTGPRTQEGKAVVACNALKHGLRTQADPSGQAPRGQISGAPSVTATPPVEELAS